MNDGKFNINCPHCGNELEADESLVGAQVTCVYCERKFIVASPLSDAPEETTPAQTDEESGSVWKRNYRWGRLYIFLSRFFAVAVLLAAVCSIYWVMLNPFDVRHSKLVGCEKTAVDLLDEQNKFSEEFMRTTALVLSGNNYLDKFKFSEELEQEPKKFNSKLMSPADVKESLEIVALYNKNIARMSDEMNQFFSKQYLEMEKMVNSGNAIKMSFGTARKGSKNLSNRWLQMSFGQNAEFYNGPHSDIQFCVKVVREMLWQLENLQSNNQLKYMEQIKTIENGLDFVDKRLNGKKESLTAGDKKDIKQIESKRTVTTGSDQFATEKKCLYYVKMGLELLTLHKHWKITEKANNLNKKLEDHLKDLERIESRFRQDLAKALFDSFRLLLAGIFAALIIMVVADFLCAHFDSAVSLQGIKRKMKVFLLLPCLSLLFLCGCGESPEECLKKELPQLINTAVDSILADKIAENRDATAYVISGKELIVITGGKRRVAESNIDDLAIASFASYYNVHHLICSVNASHKPVQKYKKGNFTHKISLEINISYQVRSSAEEQAGLPGATCHFLIPEYVKNGNFNKQEWIKSRYAMMPENLNDHAVVIAQIKRNPSVTYSEYKEFTVGFDSKQGKWEFEKASKIITYTRPPVYSETQYEQFMRGFNFKQLVTSVFGVRKTFWFQPKDHDTADKILNQGLLNDGGVWKRKEVVLNTRAVTKEILEWSRKSQISLADLEKLLQTIKANPEAENKGKAVSIAEKAILNVFLNVANEPGEKDLNYLNKLLDFICTSPNMAVVDRNKMEAACKKQLEFVNKKIKEKAAWRKNKKDMLQNIDRTIKEYYSERHVQRLIEILGKYSARLDNKTFSEAFFKWKVIAEIMENPRDSLRSLFDQRERYEQFRLLTRCSDCYGSGLKNCSKCGNSGLCPRCNGAGHRRVEWRLAMRRKSPKTTTLSCPTKCGACYGRTLSCPTCYKGYTINQEELQKVYYEKLKVLQKIVTEELSNF